MAGLTAQLFRLDGRSALVTGAGEGIGAAIARFLADAGAAVTVADIDPVNAERTAASIRAEGGEARPAVMDVTDEAAIASAFDAAGPVSILVNNAGIFPIARFADASAELFDRTLDVNLRGALLCSREAARRIDGPGAIINIASIEAWRPSFDGLAHYGAAKAGMIGLTRHLAYELGPRRITVNALLPGTIDTPGARRCGAAMDEAQLAQANRAIPVGRTGHGGDVAAAVLFLASPAATYISGQAIAVDGGQMVA